MKLAERHIDLTTFDSIDEITWFLDATETVGDGGKRKDVRVEIHSIDDPPKWTEAPPDGWGPGWLFRIGETELITADNGRDMHIDEILAFNPATGRISVVNVHDIDLYGPRATIGGER